MIKLMKGFGKMKVTFKDGSCIENGIVNVSISKVKKGEDFSPVMNITFDNTVGFADVEGFITLENISFIHIVANNGVERTFEGFNKAYITENITDDNHQFFISFDKREDMVNEDEVATNPIV